MSGQGSGDTSLCEIIGCSGEGTETRWVITEDHGRRQIRVCWKHAEGEIDPEEVEAAS